MGRIRLKVGQPGKITTKKVEGKRLYEARARVRTINGDTVQVKGRGTTATSARDQLLENARQRAYAGAPNTISGETTLNELVDLTLNHLRSLPSDEIRPQTVDQYETVKPIISGQREGYPAIGGLRLSDIDTPDVIHGWLYAVSKISPSTAKRCQAVLKRGFQMAMRRGVKPWEGDNPALQVELYRREKKPTTAPTVAEIKGVRAAAKAWQTPMKRTNLVGILNMIAATGARPNEVLALRWEDIDFLASPVTVTITGTLVELKGKASEGGGIQRQTNPKTEAGWRVLALPGWAVTELMEMRVMAINEKVFPNEDGGWLSERNIATRFRDARGETYKHITLYSYRRAVATLIERQLGVEQAAKQLGHESPAITARHYIEKAATAGDYTKVLDQLAP